jgi:hypothetical protein
LRRGDRLGALRAAINAASADFCSRRIWAFLPALIEINVRSGLLS